MTRKLIQQILALALIMALTLTAFPVLAEEDQEVTTYTLMASVTAQHGNWDDMWFFKYIEEILGIRFEITQVSSEAYSEKMNLALATNTYPDLFIGGLTNDVIATYGTQGIIIPLEEYINWEYTPTLMSWFEMYPEYEKALRFPDGHIYDIRGMQLSSRELSKCRYWINNDWAQEILGKLPDTLDEYYEYLKGVKNLDMNGNGDGNDEIPITGRFTGVMDASYFDCILPILAAFGYTERTLEVFNGKVQFNPVQDTYREFLRYMNTLYTEGLIDQEYFTQTSDQMNAKLASGVAGAFVDFAHWLNISDEEIWSQYTGNYPMTSSYNVEQIWPAYAFTFQSQQFIITDHCSNPQDLMRLIDYLMTINPDEYEYVGNENEHEAFFGEYAQYILRSDSGDFSQRYGAQLGTWEEYPDYGWYFKEVEISGKPENNIEIVYPTDDYANRNAFVRSIMSPWAFPYMSLNQAIFSLDHFMTQNKESALTENVFTYQVPYYHEGFSSLIKFTSDESYEISLLYADLSAFVDQMVSKFIIGDSDLETEWDSFVAGCKSRGLDRYVELYQIAYDRMIAE